MKVLSRDTFATELFVLYNTLGTNPDRNSDHVEKVLNDYGFEIEYQAPYLVVIDKDDGDRVVVKKDER